jgi:hypothetical protein
MLDQLFTQYVWGPFVTLSTSHGDWGDNGCLHTDGYLGIKRAGAGGRGRQAGWGEGGGV